MSDGLGNTYTYDGDNKQKSHNNTSSGLTQYFYDGSSQRVKKQNEAGGEVKITIYVYNAFGQLIAEYADPMPPVEGGGGTSYLTTDHLGSTRVVTNSSGGVKSRRDYCPFGEEIGSGIGSRTVGMGYSQADGMRQQFTGKERDAESGLDYFLARYYSSAQGRFTSRDPMGIKNRHLVNPQNFNRYAYVTNNPLRFFDPDGMEKIEVIVRTFIPQKATYFPVPAKGDNRNVGEKGTFRTEWRVTIETDPNKNGGNPVAVGPKKDTGATVGVGTIKPPPGLDGAVPPIMVGTTKASGDTLGGEVTRGENGVVSVHAQGNEPYPLLAGSPGITYNFDIQIQSEGPQGNATVSVTGDHDGFPAYEILVLRPETGNTEPTVVYSHDPRDTGQQPFPSLFPPSEFEVKDKKTVIPPPPR